jgi:hypothetical protein
MQRAINTLSNVTIKYKLKISVNKTETIAMKGKINVRTKILINSHVIKQVNSFNYLGHEITVTSNRDLEIKINIFNQMCCKIKRTLNNKTKKRDTDKIL